MLHGVALIFFGVTVLVTLFAPGAVPENKENVLAYAICALNITTIVLFWICVYEDPSLVGS